MSPKRDFGGAFTRGPLPKSKEWGNHILSTRAGMQVCPSSRYAVILVTKGRPSSLRAARAEADREYSFRPTPASTSSLNTRFLSLGTVQGRPEEALSLLATAADTPITRAYTALAHVRAGDREKGLEMVHEAERHPRQDFAALAL